MKFKKILLVALALTSLTLTGCKVVTTNGQEDIK